MKMHVTYVWLMTLGFLVGAYFTTPWILIIPAVAFATTTTIGLIMDK